MILLNNEAIKIIQDDKSLFNKIMIALAISERTMYNHVAKNSADLTMIASLNQLVEHTQRPLSELITCDKLSKLLAR